MNCLVTAVCVFTAFPPPRNLKLLTKVTIETWQFDILKHSVIRRSNYAVQTTQTTKKHTLSVCGFQLEIFLRWCCFVNEFLS